MVNKMDYGYNGSAMVPKNQKENFLMVKEIVSGHLGMIMAIKNSKQHMQPED